MTRTHNPNLIRAARGFTLIEMIVVVIIIAVLATAIGPALFKRIGGAKVGVTQNNASAVATAINLYQADTGSLPDPANLGILAARPTSPEAKGPWMENPDQLKDAWGHMFILVVPGKKNINFDVVSYGADGQPGGTGENEDIVKP